MKKPTTDIWAGLGISGGVHLALWLVMLFSLFLNLLVLTSPLYMMQIYDRVLGSGQIETLIYLSLIALFAMTVMGVLDGVRGYMLSRLGRFLDLRLRGPALVETIAHSRVDSRIHRRVIDDLATMRGYLGSNAVLPFMDAPWVPLFILIISLIHPWLGLLAIGSAAVLFGLALINNWATKTPLRLATRQQILANEFASAGIEHAEVIHGLGMQPAVSARYGGIVEDMSLASQKAGDIAAVIGSVSKAVRMIVQSAALGLGALLVIRGQMSPGGMIASSVMLGRALAPIEQSIGSWKQFLSARDAYANVKTFFRSKPMPEDRLELPALRGQLDVEGLSYQLMQGDRPILRRVAFSLEPGTAMALIGPSASGKSTLCRLLVGAVRPSTGSVRLDSAELVAMSPQDIRRNVGYLPQNAQLFAGSIRDNIARMGEVDDQAVLLAAQSAGCHEMILRLANGYETEAGAHGAFLSAGQRQRIGLARALYGQPRLLVLDEPNSNLDQDGETALIEAIQTAKAAGATVVVVSHRLSLLKPIDKVGVLQDGVLERFGDRDEILRDLSPTRAIKPVLVPDGKAS